jgi:sugar lactone lactonase YvrE
MKRLCAFQELLWKAKVSYFTDALTNKIHAYDYDDGKFRTIVDAGLPMMRKEVFGVHGSNHPPSPKQHTDLNRLRDGEARESLDRYAKDGAIDAEVVFPTAHNITACCFGGKLSTEDVILSVSFAWFPGPNNDQLFVTRVHCGAIGEDASRQPTLDMSSSEGSKYRVYRRHGHFTFDRLHHVNPAVSHFLI